MALDVLAVWKASYGKRQGQGVVTLQSVGVNTRKIETSTRETELKIMDNICLGEITQLHNTVGLRYNIRSL